MYQPKPEDLSQIELNPALQRAVQRITRNTHEVWAKEKMAQGWRYGPNVDEESKLHPSLVPFEELPQREKILDYNTTEQVVKMLLKLGFTVEQKGEWL